MQQFKRQFLMVVMFLCAWIGTRPAAAQYTANFQTNTISGITSNWPGNYLVGSNTFANALMIRNGGLLTNYDAHVGYLAESCSNYVLVAGAGSVWSNANFFLGSSGGGNTLVISNAGRVVNMFGTYVAYGSTSSSNRVLVTGTNSFLDSGPGGMDLGFAGWGNSMVISNGGRVNNSSAELGTYVGSDSNSVLVTGPGSSWTNNGPLTIGRMASNNKLTISKGGRVYSTYSTLGMFDGAGSNSVLITDTNSLWDDSTVASDINFGLNSSGNSLVITNGGQLVGYYAYFGRLNSGNNSALITGPGSSFSVNCYIYTGYQGHDNSFTAANGAAVVDKFCYISHQPNSTNNAVWVTGTNTSWQNSYSTFVGLGGVAGSLVISNGATMSSIEHNVLGEEVTSSDNRGLVTGGGSVLSSDMNLYLGSAGPMNILVVSNGGKVIDNFGSIGLNTSSVSNRMIVTGASSSWTNRSNMYVGHSSIGNSLVISNGAKVYNNRGYIGFDANSHSNDVLVSGSGTLWTNSYAVLVGNTGSGNALTIRNGGVVAGYWAILGEDVSSVDNSAYVEPGGILRCQRLRVGDYGSHNALFVNGGSVFASSTMDVGYDPIYNNCLAQLNSGEINVTNAAHTATLEVYGGGFLLAGGTLRVDTLIVTNSGAQFMRTGGTLSYQTLQLTPSYDADGDGIPNSWEQARGLDPLNPDDAQADPDGDKFSNLSEYLAGTNPTNAASRLAITSVTKSNADFRVTWKAVGGKSYVVQTNSSFSTTFSDASPVIAVPGSSETTTNYLDRGATTNGAMRFYRVRIAP